MRRVLHPAMALFVAVALLAWAYVVAVQSPTPNSANTTAPLVPRLHTAITRASTAELLGLPAGSLLTGRVFRAGSTFLEVRATTPAGENRVIGRYGIPQGVAEALTAGLWPYAPGGAGPTGFLALLGPDAAGSGVLRLLDLTGPGSSPIAAYPRGWPYAWSRSGLLSFGPPVGEADRTRVIVDPTDRSSWAIRLQLDRGVDELWTADGSAWLAERVFDRPPSRLGVVSALDGRFTETPIPPPVYAGASMAQHIEYSATGEAFGCLTFPDDMGKGNVPFKLTSCPYEERELELEHPRGVTVWWDSEVDTVPWLWSTWDTDGQGVLALLDRRKRRELVRYDRPREGRSLAVIDRGPRDPATEVLAMHQVGTAESPDLLLAFENRGSVGWYSGVSELARSVDAGRWHRRPRVGYRAR